MIDAVTQHVRTVRADTGLTAAPIDPAWVLAGEPVARMAHLAGSRDGASYTALWDCTAGTFRWRFGVDETVHVLAGEVEVTWEDGTSRLLAAGDVAHFHAGSAATWYVPTYVRKLAFLHDPRSRVHRRLGALRTRLAGGR